MSKPNTVNEPPRVAVISLNTSAPYAAIEMLERAKAFHQQAATLDLASVAKAIEGARRVSSSRIYRKYRKQLPDRVRGYLQSQSVCKRPTIYRIAGKEYVQPPDDRSEIVWAITHALLEAGATEAEAIAMTMDSVFWRDRLAEGRQLDPTRHLAKVLAHRASTEKHISQRMSVDPADWQGQAAVPREWIVDGWIPIGKVTALYGDGGTGKTTLALQMIGAILSGKPWIGLKVKDVRVYALLAENDDLDTRLSLEAINHHYKISFADYRGRVRIASRVGFDNALMEFDHDRGLLTKFFQDLLADIKASGAQLVFIDTAADTFAGNENSRIHVRQYIAEACGRIAREISGAVVLCAHPSRPGLRSGKGDGGNTAWNNSVRARLYLYREKNDQYGNSRTLKKMKANLASAGDEIDLEWRDGVFCVADHLRTPSVPQEIRDRVLREIETRWSRGIPFSDKSQAGPRYILPWLISEFGMNAESARRFMNELILHGGVETRTHNAHKNLKGLWRKPA